MSFLTRLRQLSVERSEQCFFPLDDWNVLEWAGAMAGEAGETANVAKKMRRDGSSPALQEQLGDEIADTIIYLDLLAASRGIDLEEVIARKFNRVSQKVGYEQELLRRYSD